MRAISAAIIALTGGYVFSAGIAARGDMQIFPILIGIVVGLIGLAAWAREYIGHSET
jgi:hypothetical protein